MRALLATGALAVALPAAYVGGPALARSQDAAAVFDTPFVQSMLSDTGLDPQKVRGGATGTALTVQALASWISAFSGFSVNTSLGQDWYVSDDMLKAVVEPAQGRLFVLSSACDKGAQHTTMQVTQAVGDNSVDSALNLMSDATRSFKPRMPWLLQENLTIQEVRRPGEAARVSLAASSRPAPLWRLPRLGPFEDAPVRRADVLKFNPTLDRVQCDVAQSRVDLSQSLATLRTWGMPAQELNALLRWAKAPSLTPGLLPAVVHLRLPTVGVHSFATAVSRTPDGRLELSMRSSAKQSLSWDNLRDAVPLTLFEGVPTRTVQMHKDGTRLLQAQELTLKDAQLAVQAGLDNETFAVSLSWKVPAR